MTKSIIQEMSFAFAVQIVRFCRDLQNHHKEFVLSKQLLGSGTSIGANVEEALGGQSKKDFLAKMGIVTREAREAYYWLRLIQKVKTDHHSESFLLGKECKELLKILNDIILTTRRNSISSNPNSRLRTQNSELPDTAASPARRRPQKWRSLSFAPWTSKLLTPHSKLTGRGGS